MRANRSGATSKMKSILASGLGISYSVVAVPGSPLVSLSWEAPLTLPLVSESAAAA